MFLSFMVIKIIQLHRLTSLYFFEFRKVALKISNTNLESQNFSRWGRLVSILKTGSGWFSGFSDGEALSGYDLGR